MQIRWSWLLVVGLAMAGASTDAGASDTPVDIPVLNAAFGCKFTNGQIVCSITRSNKSQGDGGGNRGTTNKRDEPSCGPGYVRLKEKNKYGSFCEPEGGLPRPAPAQAEKCKFPGEVGTPPNCTCPAGTEFMGYRGCIVVARRYMCDVNVTRAGEYTKVHSSAQSTEAAARSNLAQFVKANAYVATGPVNCKPVP